MNLNLNELKVGQRVWICDFRENSRRDGLIRSLNPTFVEVRPKEEAGKRIYYSNIYFSKIGKSGKCLKEGYAPFDNTGFRAYTGVCVQIFDNEIECREHYYKQKNEYFINNIHRAEVRLEELQKGLIAHNREYSDVLK